MLLWSDLFALCSKFYTATAYTTNNIVSEKSTAGHFVFQYAIYHSNITRLCYYTTNSRAAFKAYVYTK